MKPLVSIIVPVYKTEQYLQSCIESLLIQTYKNIQIILVDDGSPDRCPDICDEYSLMDERIHVIHKTNGGVSSARNAGLEHANGKYICFVDSDDTVPLDGIRNLYDGITNYNCQYVAGICGLDKSNKTKNFIPYEKQIDFFCEPMELLTYIIKPGSYSPYAKIFRADIIKNFGIRYNETLKCSEDALFIRQYLSHCTSIKLISKIVYQYNTCNENSLSKRRYSNFCLYYEEKLKSLNTLVAVLPLSNNECDQFLSSRAIHGLYISFKHYVKNWKDAKESKQLIAKTLNVLMPWIDVDKNYALLPKAEYRWWNKNSKLIFNNQIDRIYREICYEIKKEPYINAVKRVVSSFFK